MLVIRNGSFFLFIGMLNFGIFFFLEVIGLDLVVVWFLVIFFAFIDVVVIGGGVENELVFNRALLI